MGAGEPGDEVYRCWGEGWLKGVEKHSQLQTEGDAQHLKSFHLKVYSNGGLVILIKGVFAEPEGTQMLWP